MALMIVRRSRSSVAANRCMAPAPRSKPSRSTYMVIMNATQINQMVSTVSPILSSFSDRQALWGVERLCLGLGAVGHLTHHEHDVEEAHHKVHPREPYEREEHVARGDQRRDPL